jgi:hypothetical protein
MSHVRCPQHVATCRRETCFSLGQVARAQRGLGQDLRETILALHRATPASCACSHPVAQDVPARTRTVRARDIHAHTHDAHARSLEHTGHGHADTGHGHAGACARREHTRPTAAPRHKRTQVHRPARRARRKPGPRPRAAARTRPAHRQHWRWAASSRRPAARPSAPEPAGRRRPPHTGISVVGQAHRTTRPRARAPRAPPALAPGRQQPLSGGPHTRTGARPPPPPAATRARVFSSYIRPNPVTLAALRVQVRTAHS